MFTKIFIKVDAFLVRWDATHDHIHIHQDLHVSIQIGHHIMFTHILTPSLSIHSNLHRLPHNVHTHIFKLTHIQSDRLHIIIAHTFSQTCTSPVRQVAHNDCTHIQSNLHISSQTGYHIMSTHTFIQTYTSPVIQVTM